MSDHRRSRHRLLGIAALALLLPIAACSSDSDGGAATKEAATSESADGVAPGVASATAAKEEDRAVIDVRTPEEFAAGHVDGAVNIDVQAADFDAKVAALDKDATYVVYCRSGNRSATAAAQMSDAGVDVLDGGGIADMETAGWPVTTP